MPSSSIQSVRLPCVCIAFGLASAMLSGCHSPYGYPGQYGPGYYGQPAFQAPGYQGGPVSPGGQPLGNGGTYVPGGTAPGSSPGMSPTPINPPSTYDSGPGIQWDPKNNAPTFNESPATGRGSVPDPGDDLKNSNPGASKPTLTPTSGTGSDGLTTPFGQAGDASGGSSGAPAQPAQLEAEPDPFFEPPQQLKSSAVSGASPIQTVSYEAPQTTKLNPYGRDTKHANPTWLRGVVDYDQKQRSWSILYSANPDSRDSNGGVLTLANHPNLAKCRLGEVVLAEGAIDASQQDARGKPIYVLDNITPLQPQ